jgi:hypothetical protein
MTYNGIPKVRMQFGKILGLGEKSFAEPSGGISPFGCFFDQENDFVHAHLLEWPS